MFLSHIKGKILLYGGELWLLKFLTDMKKNI